MVVVAAARSRTALREALGVSIANFLNISASNTGGGQAHNHGFSGSATSTFTGSSINLDVQYVDVIIASKD